MHVFAPEERPESAALVVALHGCGGTAREYASSAGWIDLAGAQGFVLVLPATSRQNNPEACFRWFDKRQAKRERFTGSGVGLPDHVSAFEQGGDGFCLDRRGGPDLHGVQSAQ